jgi:hypothetical protein
MNSLNKSPELIVHGVCIKYIDHRYILSNKEHYQKKQDERTSLILSVVKDMHCYIDGRYNKLEDLFHRISRIENVPSQNTQLLLRRSLSPRHRYHDRIAYTAAIPFFYNKDVTEWILHYSRLRQMLDDLLGNDQEQSAYFSIPHSARQLVCTANKLKEHEYISSATNEIISRIRLLRDITAFSTDFRALL